MRLGQAPGAARLLSEPLYLRHENAGRLLTFAPICLATLRVASLRAEALALEPAASPHPDRSRQPDRQGPDGTAGAAVPGGNELHGPGAGRQLQHLPRPRQLREREKRQEAHRAADARDDQGDQQAVLPRSQAQARRIGARPGHLLHLPPGRADAQASSGTVHRRIADQENRLGRSERPSFIDTATGHAPKEKPPMAEQKNEQKCAHPSCFCVVPSGTKFCSEYCKKARRDRVALQLHASRAAARRDSAPSASLPRREVARESVDLLLLQATLEGRHRCLAVYLRRVFDDRPDGGSIPPRATCDRLGPMLPPLPAILWQATQVSA